MRPVEYKNQRVITTELLAEAYKTTIKRISENFNRNRDKFIEGKHYFCLEGSELREFKRQSAVSGMVNTNTSCLYLWTERGANRHCKILDTDKAWEQFDNLEEAYFRAKASNHLPPIPPDTLAKLLSSASTYIRTHERIMLHEGCSWHDVGKMARDVARIAGLPFSPMLGNPPNYEQLYIETWAVESQQKEESTQ